MNYKHSMHEVRRKPKNMAIAILWKHFFFMYIRQYFRSLVYKEKFTLRWIMSCPIFLQPYTCVIIVARYLNYHQWEKSNASRRIIHRHKNISIKSTWFYLANRRLNIKRKAKSVNIIYKINNTNSWPWWLAYIKRACLTYSREVVLHES